MNRTKIEWTDFSWNPIKGICPVRCKLPDGGVYCYGKDIYERFKWNPKPRMEETAFFNDAVNIGRAKPSKIFVCSTFDLFHPITKSPCPWHPRVSWRDVVFHEIKTRPQHTFQILTKLPQNIDRPMPDNVWLGISITGSPNEDQFYRRFDLFRTKANIRFISFEPLLYPISENLLNELMNFDWIIVGRLTGHGKKHDPQKYWIEEIVDTAREWKIPVFLKDNLRDIMGEDLIQEMPDECSRNKDRT